MKKFSRCALILIIVTIISAIAGYIFENSTITPMYTSTAKLVVTPGADNEASLRAQNGALKNDFAIVFKSDVVISAAQKTAGTSEDIASYLTVKAVPDSNIIELICTNPDQSTAKTYVDAVAKNALKTTSIVPVSSIQVLEYGDESNNSSTSIVPVSSIQVLEYGDESNNSFKPGIYRNTAVIAGIAAAICLFIELIVVFAIGAFKQEEDNSDDETEYERRFGKYSAKSEMDTYAQDAVNRAIMDAAVTKEVVDDAIKEVSYSDVITKEMVSDDKINGKISEEIQDDAQLEDDILADVDTEDEITEESEPDADIKDMAEDVKSGEDDVAETDITEDNVGEEAIAEYEVVKDSEDENEYEKETASEDEAIDADVINDLPEPEIVQAGNVRKSSSKVIGFIKK